MEHTKTVSQPLFDSRAHRANRNYPLQTYILRLLWGLCLPLYRFSPRHFYFWRNALLRLFGAEIGSGVRIYPTARVFYPWNLVVESGATVGDRVEIYSLGRIHIGRGALISQNVHLCAGTHDYSKSNLPLLTPPIRIGEGAWICADAFIGPGTTVGSYAVVGARSTVIKSVPQRTVVAGNPARMIRMRTMQ